MRNSFQSEIQKLHTKHKQKRVWYQVLTVLSCIAVFCTTYALILPAITLESSPDVCCGIEEHTHNELCYIVKDHEKILVCDKQEHTHTPGCFEETVEASEFSVGSIPVKNQFDWKDEENALSMSVILHGKADSDQPLPENAEAVLSVELNGEEDASLLDLYFASQAEMTPLLTFRLHLMVGDEEINLASCTADITLTVNPDIICMPAVMSVSEQDQDAPENVILLTVADREGELSTVSFTEEQLSQTLRFTAEADSGMLVYADNSNPSYTLQHFFWFPQVVTTGNALTPGVVNMPFINASEGTPNTIPTEHNKTTVGLTNGGQFRTFYVPTVGANGGHLKTENVLTRLFVDEETNYRSNPQMVYMNRLYNATDKANTRYRLQAIWVGTADQKNSLEENDFRIYTLGDGVEPSQIRFTNNPYNTHITKEEDLANPAYSGETAEYPYKYTILISDGSVIRLVFDVTTEEEYEKKDVSFFDYDITDGVQKPGSNVALGINSPENYSNVQSGDAHFAFGNGSFSKWGQEPWMQVLDGAPKAQTLNRANTNNPTVKQCTFGLLRGIQENNGVYTPVFADGIIAPDIFSFTETTGKTIYNSNELQLGFYRQGSTYTLSSVKQHTGQNIEYVAENLREFSYVCKNWKGESIYSNNFWPMDKVASAGAAGHDPLFGSKTDKVEGFPESDDDKHHNSYFGMSFTVDFSLAPGYIAPLNYWFYGDDDMWVFLQELDQQGNAAGTAKLVADIGGVHSSVGEYVNLWDYIEPVSADSTESKRYRLIFFYTERGASGSTCYMRFSIPMVTFESHPPEQNEALVIEKRLVDKYDKPVEQNENSKLFDFLLTLTNEAGYPHEDMYDYAVYKCGQDHTDPKIDPVRKGTITNRDFENGNYKFSLHGGEYIVITNLPDDVYYTVAEITNADYVTSYQVGRHEHIDGKQVDTLEEQSFRYSYIAGIAPKLDVKKNNYIRFTNAPVTKVEVLPGDGAGVQLGDEIIYKIEWENDKEETADVVITDPLDAGVDFIGAAFGPYSETITWWDDTGSSFTDEHGNTISYDSAKYTVVWRLTNVEAAKEGFVSLRVRVNENAYEKETKEGQFGTTTPRVENQATVQVGNNPALQTNIVENPVWYPVKSEITPGEGEIVGDGDVVTYRITWKNFLNESAVVTVRDPLDVGVDYMSGTAKAYDSAGKELSSGSIAYDENTHTLIWNLGEQPKGTEGYVAFSVKVNEKAVSQRKINNWGYVQIGNRSEVETNHIENPLTGYLLPSTGGSGTYWFTISGFAIMAGAVVSGFILKHKRGRSSAG